MKIKKTGSRRRIVINRDGGSGVDFEGFSNGSVTKAHMFLHLSPFRAIAPSGELLLGPRTVTVGNDDSFHSFGSRLKAFFKPSGELVFRAQSAR